MSTYQEFFTTVDRDNCYCDTMRYQLLADFIKKHNLYKSKCLEIGSGKGIYQDLIDDYTGLDIAPSLSRYYHKPYFVVHDDGSYPFPDNTFAAIWSIAVHEHIPDLNGALLELKRVLRPDGLVLFGPAWQCPPWLSEGYSVRPFSDFGVRGKFIKASITLRRSVAWRSLFIFPKRLYMHLAFIFGKRFSEIWHKKITPNYKVFWTSDSDACNNIDPHDAILWFESNGFQCLSHPMHLKAFFVRSGGLTFKKLPY